VPAAPTARHELAPANEEEEKEEPASLSEPAENPATADQENEAREELNQDASSQEERPEAQVVAEPAAAEPAGDQTPGDDQVAMPATADPGDGNPEAAVAEAEAPEPMTTDAQAGPTDPPAPRTIPNPERVAPSTSLGGSARDEVAADGTLIQPAPRGPLAGLRQRLGAS
jgi:hypothetical protein